MGFTWYVSLQVALFSSLCPAPLTILSVLLTSTIGPLHLAVDRDRPNGTTRNSYHHRQQGYDDHNQDQRRRQALPTHPLVRYTEQRAKGHVTKQVTGLEAPSTLVTAQTYAQSGLPFFKLYEGTRSDTQGDSEPVRSVVKLDKSN